MSKVNPSIDPIKLLDDVLKILNVRNTSHVNLQSEIEDAYYKYKNVPFDDRIRMREVLEKLVKDGYAKADLYENTSKTGYKITFEGRILVSQKGYEEKIRLAKSEQCRKVLLVNLASYGSAGAAAFGFLYLAWLVYAFWLEHCHRLYW